MKVLIFEDEPIQRLALETRLQNQGYETMSFGRPSHAIKALEGKEFIPDLALLDITLDVLSEELIKQEANSGFSRDMAGIELARQITAIKKIPIIFLTGKPGMFEEAKKVGPHSFLSKSDVSPEDTAVVNAVQLALHNFYHSPSYEPYFQFIPKGKICFNIRSSTQRKEEEGDVFRKIIIKIEDILYFNTQQEVTRLFVKGYDRNFFPTVSAPKIMKNLEQILNEKNLEASFYNVFKGHYANTNNIISYDSNYAYFDADSKIFCPLNNASYQYLLTYFAPITN